ncbi:MAG: hypothetical protein ACSHYF_13960 [Verrucomicrobiaceae bacterium]
MKTALLILGSALILHGSDTVFVEKGGVVAIEAESTESSLKRWKKKTDVADFSGECHLEFTGNKPESGPPESPLKYHFKVNKPGNYQLTIRARKRLETKRSDISNDCYVALKGDFESGGKAPLKILKTDTKIFGGNADDWGWAGTLDFDHKKEPAIYTLVPGEIYQLTISGRSQNFNFDRFLLVHESENLRDLQRKNPPESKSEGGSSDGGLLPTYPPRTLTNKDGVAIEVKLVEKKGERIIVIFKGRRIEIEIATLSDEDRKFLKEWQGVK